MGSWWHGFRIQIEVLGFPRDTTVSGQEDAARFVQRWQDHGADLVLFGAVPARDITASRDVRQVWIGGERVR